MWVIQRAESGAGGLKIFSVNFFWRLVLARRWGYRWHEPGVTDARVRARVRDEAPWDEEMWSGLVGR